MGMLKLKLSASKKLAKIGGSSKPLKPTPSGYGPIYIASYTLHDKKHSFL